MTQKRHYHPLAALRFLRKTVLLCLLPLANALLEFSLSALLTALRQDAALLLFLCGASWVLLEASSWALDDAGVLRLRWAFAAKQERILRGEALAMEADVRELRRARNHLAGAKIVLADCGLSDDAKALAACLADRGKDVVLVDGAKFHVE